MNDIRLALMAGIDIPVSFLQTFIHQPKIKEIALLGESDFFSAVQCLNVNKNNLNTQKQLPQDIDNFKLFMTLMSEKEAKDKKLATQQLLCLLFPEFNSVLFTPRSVILQGEKNLTIDESNFNQIQLYIKEMFCLNNKNSQDFNPANEKAREIAEKLKRGRQRVAELKGQTNVSIFAQYLSILAVGLHIPISELLELTMYQIYDLIERYQLYIHWDIDIRSRLAGAKPDEHPDNWMKNIH